MDKRFSKWLATFLVFATFPTAHSLELNSKIKNTDRSIFNTNPGTQIQSGLGMFSGEYSFSSNPLIIRNTTTGKVTPLVDNVMSFDIGMNYGFTNNLQIGVLLPFEKASSNKAQQFLNGPYFEAKMRFSENFAFVPFCQVGSSSYMTLDSTGEKLLLGSPNGMYGGKLVTQFGNPLKDWGVATQIGYAVSPDNVFENIDQSSRILAGVSLGAPLTEELIGAIEINAEQYKNRLPLEVLGIINYRQESYNVQLGMGSGNLQASGSNPFKMFFGVTMFFGGKPKSGFILKPRNESKKFDNYKQDYNNDNEGLYEDSYEDDSGNGPEVYEIEQSFIPTNHPSRLLASVSRGIASDTVSLEDEIMNSIIDSTEKVKEEHDDPLAEIMGEKKNKTAQDIRKSLEVAEVKEVKPVTIKLVEPTNEKNTPVVNDQKKKDVKKIVKNTKRMDKLPNGQKVKVFSEKIDEMPSEIGVVYLTEKEFQERKKIMLKNIADGKKDKVLNPKISLGAITTPKTKLMIEEKIDEKSFENFVEVRPIESKPIVKIKEKDPIVMIPEHLDVVAQDQGNELPIIPVDVLSLGKKKAEPTPIVVENKLSDEDLVKSFEQELVVDKNQEELRSVDTVSLDTKAVPQVNISVLSREELKDSLSKEFGNISLEETRQELSRKVLEEQRMITQEMARIQEEEQLKKKNQEEAEKALKLAEEEKQIREESPLTEGRLSGKASSDKELKAVDLTQRRNNRPIVVALPQARLDAFASGEPLPKLNRRGEISNSKKQLLEEDYGIEEANGPAFGFGH